MQVRELNFINSWERPPAVTPLLKKFHSIRFSPSTIIPSRRPPPTRLFATMPTPEDLPEMEYRFLGRSGLKVSAISLGGWLTYGGHVDEGTIPA